MPTSTDNWVCLMISATFKHGNLTTAEREIRRIFGRDLKEIKTVWNEALMESGGYYCLVLCSDYSAHIQELKVCAPDICVLESVDDPKWLSKREVDEFVASSSVSQESTSLRIGDIVLVSDGYLKNLYGLVYGKKGKRCCISFKTHLRTFTENIATKSLKVVGNFFQRRRFPVLSNKDGWDEVCASNIHRQEHRKRIES